MRVDVDPVALVGPRRAALHRATGARLDADVFVAEGGASPDGAAVTGDEAPIIGGYDTGINQAVGANEDPSVKEIEVVIYRTVINDRTVTRNNAHADATDRGRGYGAVPDQTVGAGDQTVFIEVIAAQ